MVYCVSNKPTVCLYVTSLVVASYEYDGGRIGPTRCALIGGRLGDRCSPCQVCRTPPAGASSARSALAAGSRLASTADPGEFHRLKTIPPSATTPCGDARPARCEPDIRPCPPHPYPF